MKKNYIYIGIFIGMIIFNSCASKKSFVSMNASDRLKHAKQLFDEGDFYNAKIQFRIITLNYPGFTGAEEAQFYKAECNFELKEYYLAAYEYDRFVKNYPASEYADDALYKTGMAYLGLSPKSSLDQEYTYSAINAFQKLNTDFPYSKFLEDANTKIADCRAKLAKKKYDTAHLYQELHYWPSAIRYYYIVQTDFYDTKYAEDAAFWACHCYVKTKQFDKAKTDLKRFLLRYPNSKYRKRAEKLAVSVNKN